ncbi:MAG TPA: DUF2784 domain-containing protein [Candidatus Aquilonibacter sp.]|nr:DUF2784 domain-containing protein [Candidatus Aquilonibacter sp.]
MVRFYQVLADCVLSAHLLFILWVIFGAFLSRGRRWLRGLHIACLLWGVLVEITSWPCPLTLLENWLEVRAGVSPYHGPFLLHYLDKTVYPDISPTLLTIAGVGVCASNLIYYGWVLLVARRRPE